MSTPAPPQAVRTVLHTYALPQLPGWESRMVLLEYPPGFAAPRHNHPIAGINYVLEGNVVSQWEGGEPEKYAAGETFMDLAETVHTKAENVSKTGWLRMLAVYVVKIGEPNVQMLE